MPSTRSTQPRLVTEPTMEPMLEPPRHSRMPTCTRCIGCCALAPAKDATSMVTATPARMNERRMRKSPAGECDASRESEERRSRGARFSMTQHRRPCQICEALSLVKKRGPLFTGPFCLALWFSAVMAMPVSVPAIAAMREPDRLQFDAGDSGRDVQPGLALHADRLQCVGIFRPTDQEVAAETHPDRCVGADAAVIAGEIAVSNPAGRRVHRPGQSCLLGDAEIDAEPADGRDVGFGAAAFALEHAFEAGHRADHEADILAALALQDARTNRRQRVGARE